MPQESNYQSESVRVTRAGLNTLNIIVTPSKRVNVKASRARKVSDMFVVARWVLHVRASWYTWYTCTVITWNPKQNGQKLTGDVSKSVFLNENGYILIQVLIQVC